MHAHEEWIYDDARKTQTLDRIVALCENCHMIKHAGFSMHTAEGKSKYSTEELISHFCRINGCTRQEFKQHEDEVFKKFDECSKYNWKLDLASITQYGLDSKSIEKKIDAGADLE